MSCVNWYGNIRLFGDAPSRPDWIDFDINFGSVEPIKQHLYRMSPEEKKSLDSEVVNAPEKNSCAFVVKMATSCILVPKPDKTSSFCTDMKKSKFGHKT